MERQTNTLSIVGMIIGILSLLFSFLPCVGMIGSLIGIAGIIVSIFGYRRAKEDGSPTLMGIIGIATSALAIIIGIFWGVLFAKATKDIEIEENIEVNTCDEALAEYEKTVKEINAIDEDENSFDNFSKVLTYTKRLTMIESRIIELECANDPAFNTKKKELDLLLE